MNYCPVCKANNAELDKDAYWRCHTCNSYQKRARLPSKIRLWTEDKGWFLRLLTVVLLVLLLQKILQNPKLSLAGQYNPFSYIDLGFHELGHFLFIPFGEFMAVAGGSIWQLVMPVAWICVFFWKRWYFASALSLAWLGSSFIGVSVYARDAVLSELSLLSLGNVSGGESARHDWEYLFAATNNLGLSTVFETADRLKAIGIACFVLGILLCLALVLAILALNRKSVAKS